MTAAKSQPPSPLVDDNIEHGDELWHIANPRNRQAWSPTAEQITCTVAPDSPHWSGDRYRPGHWVGIVETRFETFRFRGETPDGVMHRVGKWARARGYRRVVCNDFFEDRGR